jgi:hypothetical protein
MSDQLIKLIWDFRGAEAHQTAIHHEIHLKEFASREALTEQTTGVEQLSPMHSIAFLHVTKAQMILVRDALKPHRGIYVEK